MEMTRRKTVTALMVTLALLSTAASCPKQPTPDERSAQLRDMARLADAATLTVKVVRGLQDSEIAVFNSKTIPSFTLEKHQKYQRALKLFFDTAEAQLTIAKDASGAQQVRRDAVLALVASSKQLLATFTDMESPVLQTVVASVEALILVLEAEAQS